MLSKAIWKEENCICVHVYSGIASRCVSLAHAYQLAKENNVPNLVIIWQLEKWCNIKYKDVFDKDQFSDLNLTVMNYQFFPPDFGEGIKGYLQKGQIGKVIYCLGQWILYFARKVYNSRAEHLMDYFKARDTYVRYDPDEETGWGGEAYREWQMNCWNRVQGYLKDKVNFCAGIYCGLIKEDERAEAVDMSVIAFRDQFNKAANALIFRGGGTWIGVHVRRTDHDDSIRESTLDSFISKMKEAVRADEAVRFFLATDDPEVEKELDKIFPGRIFTYSGKTWGRDNKSGMESAVVDCLCLSKCDYILGSYNSVFSKFPAMYGNKKLVICKK